jgi:hypothetical protein
MHALAWDELRLGRSVEIDFGAPSPARAWGVADGVRYSDEKLEKGLTKTHEVQSDWTYPIRTEPFDPLYPIKPATRYATQYHPFAR